MAKKTDVKDVAVVTDGAYENSMTGLGKRGMDKSAHTKAVPYTPTNLVEMARMKVQDGIAAFLVDGFPEAALMKDITIINDKGGEALKKAGELGLIKALKKAGSNIRLTGGSVVVTEYEGDTQDTLKRAPSEKAKVKGYSVYSAGKVDLSQADFKDGRKDPRIFRMRNIGGGTVDVHFSRCTVFKGEELPDVIENNLREAYFGVSSLRKVEQDLKDLGAVTGAVVNMAQETGTLLMRMSNLSLLLSKPDCGVDDIHKVMSLLKLTMNSMRAAFAGKDDGFEILTHNFAGLPEIMTKLMSIVSAKGRCPMSILFGQSATGLAQTNEGDIKEWAQSVSMWRSDYLYDGACRLIADMARRNLNSDLSEFTWGEIDEMTVKQLLEAKKLQAETFNMYYNMGSVSSEEIRETVFVNGHGWELSVRK